MTSIRENVIKYIKEKYTASPEYLWKRYPDYAVFRHDDNQSKLEDEDEFWNECDW